MTTIELSNPTCRLQVSPANGGRATSFYSVRSGVEHVGPYHLQTWIKTGTAHDPTTSVLHLFHADFHTKSFEVDTSSPSGCVSLVAAAEGIQFRKRFRLDPSSPLLTFEYEVINNSDAPRIVQFETFFNWNFGPTVAGRDVVTVPSGCGKATPFHVPPYGAMGGYAFDLDGGNVELCDVDHNETVRILPDANWWRFAIYQMSGTNWRGPYSPERLLQPGEKFRATLQLALFPGCNAQSKVGQASCLSPPPRAKTDRQDACPTFPIRAIHLIGSQQSLGGLSLDALKWLLEQVIAPCGYTHVIFEFNKSLRLNSHPELAADNSYSPSEIRGLALFGRSLGLEVIPQQNLYGHQHETNITRAHPELQEVPGDLSVYCPTHPKTRRIVADIVRELLDIFEPRQFHIGHDEIQFHGREQRVGVCPRCRAQQPHEVFAYDVAEIHAQLRAAGVRAWMWGDMVTAPEFVTEFAANANGIAGEVYRAIDLLPRDIVIADWHYYTCEDYRSSADFLARGFEVCPAVWWSKEGIRKYADYARSIGVKAMMMTTWASPDLGSLPLESILYAARVFQDVAASDDPDLDKQVRFSAQHLWREWTQWKETADART
jgi:hypothetical protein